MSKHEEMAREIVYTLTDRPLVYVVASALSRIEQETEARVLEKAARVVEGFMPAGSAIDAFLGPVASKIRALSHTTPTANEKGLAEGYVRVPREPTLEMMRAAAELAGYPGTREKYIAMIQAAPDTDVSTEGGLIDGAIIATSVEADFSKGTWTLEPKGEWSVMAGDYYLIPVKP